MKPVGSNEERRNALLATIGARILLVREFLRTGEPKGFQLPGTMLQFRQMNIPELNIFPIRSPSTLNAKQTPALAALLSAINLLLKHLKCYEKHPVKVPELDIAPASGSVKLKASRTSSPTALASEIAFLVEQLERFEKHGGRAKAPSMSETIRRLRRDIRKKDLTIAGLSRANHEQAVDIEQLGTALDMARGTIASLTDKVNALRRQYGDAVIRLVRTDD